MRTISFRTIASGALALLAMVNVAAAQETRRELSTLQVTQAITSGQPADHARLRDHFGALAERYTADAAQHAAMANAYAGNPNRTSGAGLAAHCRHLGQLATDAATTLRELAEHHNNLAAGVASVAPADGKRFEAGEGARKPTDREIGEAAANANSPADHRAIEEYFVTLAARRTAEANTHVAMAQAYRGNPNRRGGDPAAHCDRMIKLLREAATEAQAAAKEHRQLRG
jgi:hypothetical protein